MIKYSYVWERLEQIRSEKPLVLSLTNIVVTNFTANVLLALGASPAMTKSEHEVEELTSHCRALVLNTGTPTMDQVHAMRLAAARAKKLGIPVVLDPVGAGASKIRIDAPKEFIRKEWISVVRGNASEIMALGGSQGRPRGVDSLHSSDHALDAAIKLSASYGCVVCVSGEEDLIVSGQRVMKISNGHKMMTLITGMGCASTTLVAAFAAVEKDCFKAAAMGMAVIGLAGELSADLSSGPGSMAVSLMDTLYSLDEKTLEKIRYETEHLSGH